MENRPLGKSGVNIPPLVFGGNVFGWTADQATSFRLLNALLDAGFNAIDTADSYSTWVPGHEGGESETIIGNWLKQRGGREKVLIFTKVGSPMGRRGKGLSKAWIIEEAEHSLTRLQTNYIDLYQSHRDDELTPIEETLEAYAALIKQGKVRAIGASNFSASRLKQALEASARLGLPRYESLQPEYNLMERAAFETGLAPLCQTEQIGVISYYALASGFLTGKYRSEADLLQRPRGAAVQKYLNARGGVVLKALDEAAASHAATPAQVAIAWLMAQPAITAPIASATSLDQLQDLLKAASLTLEPEEIDALNRASGG
jgi:aryl-alcohol dehydrogenase-like predicted oxidoreductase